MDQNPNLSETQFPKITGSRNEYGTTSVHTDPHRVDDHGRTIEVSAYHWDNGDAGTRYIRADGRAVKKDGTTGRQPAYTLRTPPEHVLNEMKRLRGE